MDAKQLNQIIARLRSTTPLLGKALRRAACRALAADSGAETVPFLFEALTSTDMKVEKIADLALRSLKKVDAINALCALWTSTRNDRIGAIIGDCKYVAQRPVEVRVLSALKSGNTDIAGESSSHIVTLATALTDCDPAVKQCAKRSLRSLRKPDAIDALCAQWVKTRDEQLGRFISESKYVAQQPVHVRVLSALKSNRESELTMNSRELEALVSAVKDNDRDVATRADAVLRGLSDVSSRDALCSMAIREPSGVEARICIEEGWRPANPEDMCLFLCVTRQLNEYFREDFEFQNLRAAYDRADVQVRANVMDVVRSGDRRWQGFFGVRKPVSQCTRAELELAIELGLKHKEWARLWSLVKQVSLKYTWPILGPLGRSGWKPDNKDDRETFDAVMAAAAARRDSAFHSGLDKDPYAFADLLEEGKNGDLARKTEAELISALKSASPPDAIPIVGAINARYGSDSDAAQAVMSSPHWMVSLAGVVAGLGPFETGNVPNVEGLSLAKANLESFWPLRALPEDIENLRTWTLQSVAKDAVPTYLVLEQLMLARLSMGVFEEFEVVIRDDTGEFEEAK